MNNNIELNELIAFTKNSMEDIVDKVIYINFEDILNYKFPTDEAFGLQVIHDEILFCFIIRFSSKNKNLFCFGPIARGKSELNLTPFFTRWSWYKYFEESTLAYADPTFFINNKLNVGWFVGGKKWYLELLAEIINELSKNQRIINENILFFGTSAGGFSSICLGTLLKNSKVFINNSQTNLLEHSLFNESLLDTLEKDLDMEKKEILEKFKYRFNVYELFKKEEYVPPITYYVNVLSRRDVEVHAKFLIDGLYKLKNFNNFDIHFYSQKKKDPHHPLPVKKTINILKNYSKNNLNNFSNMGSFRNDIENMIEIKSKLNKTNEESLRNDSLEENSTSFKDLYSYLLKYETARIDIKNKGEEDNSIEILYNSDEKSKIDSPNWFKNEEGKGFVFYTNERRLDLKIKCINDGILNIILRGIYFKDQNKLVPIYIKYNNVQINDMNVLDNDISVWHNKPHYIRKKVKDGDILFISIFWTPI